MLCVSTLKELNFTGNISEYRQDAFRATLDAVEFSVKSSLQRYLYLGVGVYRYFTFGSEKRDAAAHAILLN